MERIEADSLVGAWHLQRWETVYPDGTASAPFGPGAVGLLLYTADGWMSASIMAADSARLSSDNPRAAPAAERAAAFDAYFSYGGRWSLAEGTVRHEVTVALNPAMVGTVQVREARVDGRTLTLSAVEAVPGGARRHRLSWRR
jgi:hypothetical protein